MKFVRKPIKKENSARFKKILIGVAIFLAVADVYFLFDDNFFDKWSLETISKVALYSSPKYLVFIWLFGFLSAHFFLPRRSNEKTLKKRVGFASTIILMVCLTAVGQHLSRSRTCQGLDYPNFTKVPFFMEGTCRNAISNRRVECELLDCHLNQGKLELQKKVKNQGITKVVSRGEKSPNYRLKYDLTTEMKFLLIIFGAFCGYFIWPQKIKIEPEI